MFLQEVLEKLTANDEELKDVNLNNIANIEEKQMCEIFDSLRSNKSLTRLSVVNCDVSWNVWELIKDKSISSINISHHSCWGF